MQAREMGETRVDRLFLVEPGKISGVIHGSLANKSNSRKIVTVRGRPMIIKSKEAREYEEKFRIAVLGSACGTVEGEKLYLKATVYQENMRRDLDVELLPDLLQKNGVIRNDRQIWEKHYVRQLDKLNPRVEFEIGVVA